MPFKISNAPATFQATMITLLNIFTQICNSFFNDILIYSSSMGDHLIHLPLLLFTLHKGKFFLKFSKCFIWPIDEQTIEYLGHIISCDGVSPDKNKIYDMLNWPVPTTIKQLRGFLGLTGFFQRFIKNYAKIVFPLTEILKEDSFIWTSESQSAFESLKIAMIKHQF